MHTVQKRLKTQNTTRKPLRAVLLTAILLTANTTSAQEPKTRAGDGQGTVALSSISPIG